LGLYFFTILILSASIKILAVLISCSTKQINPTKSACSMNNRIFFKPALYSLAIFVFLFANTLTVQALELPAAAIATAHPLATKAGHKILQQGGNAFDAAVAITASLAVVEPTGSGLGGGGFWLIHREKDKHQTMIDGREKAPKAAHRDMYLDKTGNVIPGLSMNGPLSAGIPGTPAGMVHLAKK
jgi:gamma-glutamyltranspeptidase / glutathione hydrolase